MEQFISKAKDIMNYMDRVLAIVMLGAMLAITPLYASASIVKAHTHVVRVPMLTRINAKLLANTLMPVRGTVLKDIRMRLPPVLPRRAR